ncbi:hypothetical protein ACLESO_27900 [Pyxidicoccus sp. 3LG]
MAPVRPELRPTPGSAARPTAPQSRGEVRPQAQSDGFEQAHNPVSQVATGARSLADGVAATQVRGAPGPQRFGPWATPGQGNSPTVEGVNTGAASGAAPWAPPPASRNCRAPPT